jgi:hypothetical protein
MAFSTKLFWFVVAYISLTTRGNISFQDNPQCTAVAGGATTPSLDNSFDVDSCASDHICHDKGKVLMLQSVHNIPEQHLSRVSVDKTISSAGFDSPDFKKLTRKVDDSCTRADTTFDSDNFQPAGAASGPPRVFVSGSPWPVAVLYSDAHTVSEVDPVLLSHLRFGHVDCRQFDTFLDKIATVVSLEKGKAARCNPATNCAVCKLVKAPLPGRFPVGDYPQRHKWREKPKAPDVLNEFLDNIKQSGHRPKHITVYVGHDDASPADQIYSPATDRTKVVGTPNFIKDVGTCASRLIDSASVSALPVDPTVLFYNSMLPSTTLLSIQRQPLTSSASERGAAKKITSSSPWSSYGRPAATSCGQQ